MSLRIGTNIASLVTQRQMDLSQRSTERAMKALSSGSKHVNIGSDAAGFAISERLRGQINGLKAAKSNAENATSFVQVAEGGLNEQNNILIRMRELAIQSASDTYSDTERGFLDLEFTQLASELDRIAKTTQFGSTKLLEGKDQTFEFQVGANKGAENVISYKIDTDTTSASLGIDGLTVDDIDSARDSLDSIDTALVQISEARSQFGAMQSRLESVSNNHAIQIENLSAAHSRLADTDLAEAVSEMTKGMVMQQFQAALLSQANQIPQYALKLIA